MACRLTALFAALFAFFPCAAAEAAGPAEELPIDWHAGTERLDTCSFEELAKRA